MRFIGMIVAAAMAAAPCTAAWTSPPAAAVDEDLLCVTVLAASIQRARRLAPLPADQQETVKSWEHAVAYFAGRALDRYEGGTLRAAVDAANAEAERRDAYQATLGCDSRYREGMRRLQQGFGVSGG